MKYNIISDKIVSKPYEISYREIVLNVENKIIKFLVDSQYWDESWSNKEAAIYEVLRKEQL